MRIAYVTETYPPEINGVSLTVQRTVHFLREQGHQVELIRPRQPGETPCDDGHELRTAGMPIPMYPDLRLGLARSAVLARRFAESRPDLVHVVTQGPLGYAALLAALKHGLPITTDFRTNFHFYSQYYRLGWLQPVICRYLRNFHNRARRTFVPSQMMRRELAAEGFMNLDVVGRGVDAGQFSPARRSRQLRLSWGVLDDDQRVVLYVGRLAREKNVGLALRAFEAASRGDPGLRMIVVGDGPLRRQLQNEFPAAHFVGTQHGEALAGHYASADLFVFPSLSETFGNVTLEALASGLAVIAFDAAAAADYIAHGDNGMVVAPGDEQAFIETLGRCAAMRREAFAALRERARETALQADWDKVLEGFEKQLAATAFNETLEPRHHVVMA